MYVQKLRNWCRGEGLNEDHALLTIVPDDTEIKVTEDVLTTIKCLGRVRVRGRMLTDAGDELMVLCECKEKVTGAPIPPEVVPAAGAKAWPIYTVTTVTPAATTTVTVTTAATAAESLHL